MIAHATMTQLALLSISYLQSNPVEFQVSIQFAAVLCQNFLSTQFLSTQFAATPYQNFFHTFEARGNLLLPVSSVDSAGLQCY